ncbi:MAG: WD40 repeat domain-containing protein, partial [Chloroflexota bacterium]
LEGATAGIPPVRGRGDTLEGATAGIPPVRGRGDTLAWSPTGDAIVYTTASGGRAYFTGSKTFLDLPQGQLTQLLWSPTGAYLALEADQNIWWLYRRDGDNLVLTSAIPSAVGLTFVNASQVVFAPADGGLLRMDLAAANAQTSLLDNTWNYALPYLLADGTLAVFGRQKDDTEVPEGSGRLLGLASSSPSIQNLSDAIVELNGLNWSPGGNLLIAFRGGVMALVLPSSGQGLTLPISEAVAYSWGPTPPAAVTGLKLPSDGFFITEGADGIKQVWRLPKDGNPSEPITQAAADVTVFALSPNQRNLAYRSGGSIWIQALNGAGEPKVIADIGSREVLNIAFSTDGTRIAYDINNQAGLGAGEGGIWLVSAQGGDAEILLPNGPAGSTSPDIQPPYYTKPQFSPSVNGLLINIYDSENTDVGLLDLSTREVINTTNVGDRDDAIWLGDGRILDIGAPGLQGGSPVDTKIAAVTLSDNTQRILASMPFPVRVLTVRQIAAGTVRVALGSVAEGPQVVNVVDMDTTSGALTSAGNGGFMTNPQLSPDGAFLAGQTHPGGPLIIRDLKANTSVVINEPPNINGFTWGI